ncbi:MAG: hypothetical protein CL424_11175 [Acidimicrobiaceae bacterium]|nr:hypothetical protein [Acidimicrobiaceae bacterium]
MDYVDLAEQLAGHHAEIRRHLEAAQSGDVGERLQALAEAQRHTEASEELLAELRAIDPSLGRMTAQDAADIRQLFDE